MYRILSRMSRSTAVKGAFVLSLAAVVTFATLRLTVGGDAFLVWFFITLGLMTLTALATCDPVASAIVGVIAGGTLWYYLGTLLVNAKTFGWLNPASFYGLLVLVMLIGGCLGWLVGEKMKLEFKPSTP